jgi:hypothetical protein
MQAGLFTGLSGYVPGQAGVIRLEASSDQS